MRWAPFSSTTQITQFLNTETQLSPKWTQNLKYFARFSSFFQHRSLVNYKQVVNFSKIWPYAHYTPIIMCNYLPPKWQTNWGYMFYINLLIRGSPEIMLSKLKYYEIKSSKATKNLLLPKFSSFPGNHSHSSIGARHAINYHPVKQ